MANSIIIIGAGLGGLAAGIYGRRNGYRTQIFELHTIPGGQCTGWKRKGYTFDVCIHHLFGCSPASRIHELWRELGVMPRELVRPLDCTAVGTADGRTFWDYYDLEALEKHLRELSPADEEVIRRYVRAIRLFDGMDLMGEMLLGSMFRAALRLLLRPTAFGFFSLTMRQFAERFTDPFLRRAFPLLVYSAPETPMFLHLARHAEGLRGGIQWPIGGALAFARSMEARYLELGGEVSYKSRVTKILVENDRAVGVRLADGTEHRADHVVSDADGRKTILELLDGRYMDEETRRYCAEPDDETNWAVHVFLGVNRDLSREPSALILLLDDAVTIAGHKHDSLEMQLYGLDRTLAPEGKGVIKVELVSGRSYWAKLHEDKAAYKAEKDRVAAQVIDVLERRFPGIREQVEAIDVPTVMTWERYMAGTHGFANTPKKPFRAWAMMGGKGGQASLPGLRNFHFAGAWATMVGALFSNALSGKHAVQAICRQDGKAFTARG
jgi:phytoene dehydrogenase-like protein